MKKAYWTALALLLALPVGAMAKADKPIVKAQNKQDFAAVVAAVDHEMMPGGRFEYVTPDERRTVDDKLAEMGALFDKSGTVEQMDAASKLTLFNDQEQVNGILTHRDGDRLVCEHAPPLGTNIPRTTCHTYRELARSKKVDEDAMTRMRQLPQPSGRTLPTISPKGH